MCAAPQYAVDQFALILQGGGGGGGGKVSTNTLALIAQSLSAQPVMVVSMTNYHYWFEEFVKSKNIGADRNTYITV